MSVPLLYLAKSFPASGGPSDTAWDTSHFMIFLAFGAAIIENLSVFLDVHLPGSRFHLQAAE
jgi:hypothetical protein